MKNKKRVCVFASATNELDEIYYKTAIELGEYIANNNYDIVYGGSHRGLMYACAKSVKENGGEIYAVMPEIFVNMGLSNPEDCAEFYITSGMRERKAKLDEISDCVIAISGGFGTLEELSEIIVQKSLGYNNKAIVILNTNGFYDDLIKFFDSFIDKNFAAKSCKCLYYVANSPQDAINYINNYAPKDLLTKYAQ